MSVDAGVDVTRLVHLIAWREVRVDAVDASGTRIVERDQNMLRGNVRRHMDRARRQPYRRTVLRQTAALRIDAQRGDVMLGADRARTWSTAAGRNIKITSRCVRPGILHARRQCDRLASGQPCTLYIDVPVRQIRPHVCVERDLWGCGLGGSQSGCGHAASDKCQKFRG